jgi:hypothetical protein
MASYEGEGTYSSLKVGAVVVGVLSVIGAIGIGLTSTEPHLELDAVQGVTVSEDADPTVIVAAIIVFAQGILLALVLWAIGTIGQHVVALRKASVRKVEEPFTRPIPAPPPADLTPESRPSGEQTYIVVLHSLGSARPRHLRRLVSGHTGDWIAISALKEPDLVIASRLSDVKAEALRADLEEAGASASVEEQEE